MKGKRGEVTDYDKGAGSTDGVQYGTVSTGERSEAWG